MSKKKSIIFMVNGYGNKENDDDLAQQIKEDFKDQKIADSIDCLICISDVSPLQHFAKRGRLTKGRSLVPDMNNIGVSQGHLCRYSDNWDSINSETVFKLEQVKKYVLTG